MSEGGTAPAAADSAARLARAWAAAAAVVDPELTFLTVADMGILRDIALSADGAIEVTITPTYSGCPAMDVIRLDLELALAKADVGAFRVLSVLAPAWTTDWLTPEALGKLAAHGIAPPGPAGGKRALFAEEELACPRCGSVRTRRISAFSSTPCKAHHACLDCLEPFEHFKCH
jgi:ring-1,2-phenylacetyl-CoA epoxidase subunit PaaD